MPGPRRTFGGLAVRVSSRHDRDVVRRLLRASLHLIGAALVVALSGATVQANAERAAREAFPAPGQLVDVGDGQLIHLRTWGSPTEGPTILLDVSAGQPSSIWAWIARDLGRHHRVVAYDRPGMAWSGGPDGPRDAQSSAEALTKALSAAGIGPPYVVVGHSFGGLSARVFAAEHRQEVLGLVLLDTTQPDAGGGAGFEALYRSKAWQGHSGLFQLFPPGDDYAQIPLDEAPAAYAVSLWTTHLDATADELEAWDASAAEVRAAGDFGDLPLLVVSSVGSPDQDALQRDLTRLSSNSQFVELNASHMGMLMDRDQASAVSGQIERFVDALRGSQ